MKVLVTGGAGYVGSVLIPLLLQEGYEVRVFDNLMFGGTGLLMHVQNPRFEFQKGDICDQAQVEAAVSGCDAIIHLAAIVGFPACQQNPRLARQVNVEGSRVLARAAERQRYLLYASTGSNYGSPGVAVCNELTPLKPTSLYGKTKAAAEEILMQECSTIAFRFATAFGVSPRIRLDLLVNDFVYTAVKKRYLVVYEPLFVRSFIHVADMARSLLFGLQNAHRMTGQVYNVGSDALNYTKAQLCDMIRDKIDYYLHYAEVGHDADKRDYAMSFAKIANLGFRTTISLQEGIEELIKAIELLDPGSAR